MFCSSVFNVFFPLWTFVSLPFSLLFFSLSFNAKKKIQYTAHAGGISGNCENWEWDRKKSINFYCRYAHTSAGATQHHTQRESPSLTPNKNLSARWRWYIIQTQRVALLLHREPATTQLWSCSDLRFISTEWERAKSERARSPTYQRWMWGGGRMHANNLVCARSVESYESSNKLNSKSVTF